MSSSSVIKADGLLRAVPTLKFLTPVPNKGGGRSGYVQFPTGVPLRFQTTDVGNDSAAWCGVPFGISTPYQAKENLKLPPGERKPEDWKRLNMEVSVQHGSPIEAAMIALSEKCLKEAEENYKVWFTSNSRLTNSEQVKLMYRPLLADPVYPKDENKVEDRTKDPYDRTFRVKVNVDGPFATKFFQVVDTESGRKMVPIDLDNIPLKERCKIIPPRSRVVVLAHCGGVWFMSREFGVGMTALKILFLPPGMDDLEMDLGDCDMTMADPSEAAALLATSQSDALVVSPPEYAAAAAPSDLPSAGAEDFGPPSSENYADGNVTNGY